MTHEELKGEVLLRYKTLAAFGEMIGISRNTIYDYFAGRLYKVSPTNQMVIYAELVAMGIVYPRQRPSRIVAGRRECSL